MSKSVKQQTLSALGTWIVAFVSCAIVASFIGFGPYFENVAVVMGGPVSWIVVFAMPRPVVSPYWMFLVSLAAFYVFQRLPCPWRWSAAWIVAGIAFPILAVLSGALS